MIPGAILVAGAGAVGGFLGGLLTLAGRDVRFLARPPIVAAYQRAGLTLSDLDGLNAHLAPERLRLTGDPADLAAAEVILVTVKSGATEAMATLIARYADPTAVVVSLQNGVGNIAILRRILPGHRLLAGMVPYNVVAKGANHLHRGTSGTLLLQAGPPDLSALLAVPHLALRLVADMAPVQWGKLVLNLNNALNGLSGLTLQQQLLSPDWRRVLAAQLFEALAVLAAARIPIVSPVPLPLPVMAWCLRLPTPLFRRLAGASLRIDKEARSSLWTDLEKRRPTEIGMLQGEIIALAERLGMTVPLTRRVAALVRAAEQAGRGPPNLPASAVRKD